MILYIPNEKHKNLIFLDTEFNERKLVQISMIIYEAFMIEDVHTYLLKGSINVYIQNDVNPFFTRYTGITQGFLNDYAVTELEALHVLDNLVKEYNNKDCMLVAHGLKQDVDLLMELGLNLNQTDRYCTYESAKSLLKRDKNLKLIDVCNESGYFAEIHDAYSDAKNVVHAFSFLKLVEVAK